MLPQSSIRIGMLRLVLESFRARITCRLCIASRPCVILVSLIPRKAWVLRLIRIPLRTCATRPFRILRSHHPRIARNRPAGIRPSPVPSLIFQGLVAAPPDEQVQDQRAQSQGKDSDSRNQDCQQPINDDAHHGSVPNPVNQLLGNDDPTPVRQDEPGKTVEGSTGAEEKDRQNHQRSDQGHAPAQPTGQGYADATDPSLVTNQTGLPAGAEEPVGLPLPAVLRAIAVHLTIHVFITTPSERESYGGTP